MKCQKCGLDNGSPWLTPVYSWRDQSEDNHQRPIDMNDRTVWWCLKCDAPHRRDGSLWPEHKPAAYP